MSSSTSGMSQCRGANREDAIVLDDEDVEEPDLVDLFDYHPPAKETPTTSRRCSDSPSSSATGRTPRLPQGLNFPSYKDDFAHGENSKGSAQSVEKPVVRHEKDRETVPTPVSPGLTRHGDSTCNDNPRVCVSAQVSQPRSARASAPTNGPTPALRPNVGASSPNTKLLNDQEQLETPLTLARAIVIPQQQQDLVDYTASQPSGNPSTNHTDPSKESKPKKPRTLAERMNLAKLPAITNDHGRPMGFAALAGAKIYLPHSTFHAGKEGERADRASTASTANRNPKTVPSVVPQGISITAAPPCSLPAKPVPKRAPAKKSYAPLPTFEMLKPNRKRPLSKIGAFELFVPSQVVSEAAFERKKRQRLEKGRDVALTNGSTPKELQTGLGTGFVDSEQVADDEFEELPDVVEFGECHMSKSGDFDTNEMQDAIKSDPDGVLETKGDGSVETRDTMDAIPSGMAGKIGSVPVNTPININGLATKYNETYVIDPALTEEIGEAADEVDLRQVHEEHDVAATEEFEPVCQQDIESERPAAGGGKRVRFDESALNTQWSGPRKQINFDLPSLHDEPIATREAIRRYPEPTLSARPTNGGKGISEATLAAWRAAEDAEDAEDEDIPHTTPYHGTDDQEEGLIIVTEPVYDYYVYRREWLIEDPEGEVSAGEQVLGPWQTLQEANTVAASEIRQPIQLGRSSGITSSAWEYGFRQDLDGLQTQYAEAVGVHIEAEVRRKLAPPDECPSFPASAFRITPRVYLVQELFWFLPPTPKSTTTPPTAALPLCETFTHACCTNLDRANRKASEQWLAAYVGAWSDFGVEGKKKDAVEKELRFDLKELNEGKECFHREVVFKDGGMCKIWVVEVEVEGPRN